MTQLNRQAIHPAVAAISTRRRYARSPQFEGVETIDGEEVHVVSFDVQLREFFSRLPSAVQTWLNSFATKVSGKVWIGVEDLRTRRLVYHVVLRTPWSTTGSTRMQLGAVESQFRSGQDAMILRKRVREKPDLQTNRHSKN